MPRGSEPLSENGETTGKDWVSEVTSYPKQHFIIAKKYREVKSRFEKNFPVKQSIILLWKEWVFLEWLGASLIAVSENNM